MKHGVYSANHVEADTYRKKLIDIGNNGLEPYEGYFVAYSYLEFSRWMYRFGDYEKAIRFAHIASKADRTWAEPDFILGWYGLLLSRGNAEEHLSNAIKKDRRIVFRISNNELCKQYPHIINKLKLKYSALDTGS